MSESNFQARKDENFNECSSIASSVSSNNSFRQRLREKFVFSNSNSHEIGQKAMEMKFENFESELHSKNEEIRKHKAGIKSAGVLFKELKSKLKEKDKELNEVRAQLCNEEDFSSIKSLLESQKDSIIQSCMEMLDNNEESPVVIKVGMEMNERKMVSEIAIHKEEIVDFKSQSDAIRSEIRQKDLDLGKMQKEVEDLKTELQLKDKKIEEQQVEIDTVSLASMELNQDTKKVRRNLRTKCSVIETLEEQVKQERQNSNTIWKSSEVENAIRSEIVQDLEGALEKAEKEVEDLKTELQLKDKKIEDQQVKIDNNSLSYFLSTQLKLFKNPENLAQLEQERQNSKTFLENSGPKRSEVENGIRYGVEQKDLKLEEMQKKVEDLEKELQIKNKEIEDQQVEIDTNSLVSIRESERFHAQLEQEKQNSVQILQNLSMRCSEIEFMKTQLEQERQNSITILQNFGVLNQNFEIMKAQLEQERQNFGILNQNFELLKAQFGQEGQKDLKGDLEKMQKEVEDLKTELRLKDEKIEDQQADIDTIMEYYQSHEEKVVDPSPKKNSRVEGE